MRRSDGTGEQNTEIEIVIPNGETRRDEMIRDEKRKASENEGLSIQQWNGKECECLNRHRILSEESNKHQADRKNKMG